MAPGRKRGAKGAKAKSELSLGDLVLAKVKGFPAWPAKISRPEDWERTPDPKKYFVQFFGTSEIAFVAPADIQAFTSDAKNKLSARCLGKTVKYFAQAVKEICEEFEESQLKNLSSLRADKGLQDLASESNSLDPVVDEALEVSGSDGINREGLDCERDIKGMTDISVQESQRQGEMECQDIKHCSSDDVKHSPSPHISSGKKNKHSSNLSNQVNSVSSPSRHTHHMEEGSRDIKVEGGCSDGGQNNLTNGHQLKLAKGLKKNPDSAIRRNSGSAISHVQRGDVMQRKFAASGNSKVSAADNSRSGVDVGSERKETKLLKQKKHSEATDDSQLDAEGNMEEHIDALSRKKMKAQHGHEKQNFLTTEASSPAKMPKFAVSGDDTAMERAQRKNNSRSPNVAHNDKMTGIESKRSAPGGKGDSCRPFRVHTSTNESNHPTDEDDLPPTKRHRRALRAMSSSALTSENKLGSFVSRNNDLVSPNKTQSPVMQLPTKRRAVLRCDDDEDELPKTPIHGGITNKASAVPSVSNLKKKPVTTYVLDKPAIKNSGTVGDDLKEQVQSFQVSNRASSPTALQVVEKSRELSAEHVSPSLSQLDSEKLVTVEAKSVSVSPKMALQSTTGTRASAELQNKQFSKAPGNINAKKASAGAYKPLATASERSTSSLNQSMIERSKPAASSGEKRKSTPKSNSQFNDPVLLVRNPDENIITLGDRLDVGKNEKRSLSVDSKPTDSAVSMKNLIAAAQARKREAHILNSYGNHLPFSVPDADMLRQRTSPAATLAFESSNMFQLEVQGLQAASPSSDVCQLSSVNQQENEEFEERRVSSGHRATGSSLSGGTEAAVARDAFEGMIETLSRTKESIGRATRLAIDCAKYGIANEVVELLIQKLENESSFHRRVDLFFLVDSITQCSHGQKGVAGASYIPIVQAALPRLIGAAAPPGASAQENRRQCQKVLRLWLERKILPEYALRRYMNDIGVANIDAPAGFSFRRPSRAERAIDDPIREMEGMFVDEYGSNASFQLPGLLSSRVFEEEEDEDDFPVNLRNEVADASPSKHTPAASRDPENYTVTPNDRRHCILEDVDGELEMEDVSGHLKDDRPFPTSGTFEHEPNFDGILESASNTNAELFPSPEGSPPLPPGSPPVTPPLPSSPPPPPPPLSLTAQLPPPPPLSQPHQFPPPPAGPPPPPTGPPPPPAGPPPPPAGHPPVPAGPPPPLLPHQSLHPQPTFMSQNMTSLPSTIATSPASSYQPPAFVHEVGGTSSGYQRTPIILHNQGSHLAASGRSEALSQQSSCFPPAGVGSAREAREQIGYVKSRPAEYGQGDAFMNPQASQHRHPFLPGGAPPFAQRPLHPEPPPQRAPNHFSYPNSVQQHQYSAYPLPSFSDGPRRNTADEPWRIQVNEFNADCTRGGWMEGGSSAQPYSHEGYVGVGLLTERPPQNTVMFQPSAPITLPAAPIPVHGAQMMPCRPDMSAINWRPP